MTNAEGEQGADHEPFGRQPQPVRITIEGDPRDVDYYILWIAGYVNEETK